MQCNRSPLKFTMASPDSFTFVTCAQCEPAVICEENGAQIANLPILPKCWAVSIYPTRGSWALMPPSWIMFLKVWSERCIVEAGWVLLCWALAVLLLLLQVPVLLPGWWPSTCATGMSCRYHLMLSVGLLSVMTFAKVKNKSVRNDKERETVCGHCLQNHSVFVGCLAVAFPVHLFSRTFAPNRWHWWTIAFAS